MSHACETLWRVYDTINEWIRFSDTKAGAVLAVNGVIVATFFTDIGGFKDYLCNHPLLVYPLILGILTELASIYFALCCLSPTLKTNDPTSLIYFAQIAQAFETPQDFEEKATAAFDDGTQSTTQIAQQVWANSHVAWKKCRAVNKSIVALAFTVILGIVAVALSLT